MTLYARSCERPSKRSARRFLPSSVSNSYCFSTGTQGSSRRLRLISSFRSACSDSSLASSSRAVCHSSRVPSLCSGIFVSSSSGVTNKTYDGQETHRDIQLWLPEREHVGLDAGAEKRDLEGAVADPPGLA